MHDFSFTASGTKNKEMKYYCAQKKKKKKKKKHEKTACALSWLHGLQVAVS